MKRTVLHLRQLRKKLQRFWKFLLTKKMEKKRKRKNVLTAAERKQMIEQLTREMKAAAKLLEFEHAAYLRDKIKQLQEGQK